MNKIVPLLALGLTLSACSSSDREASPQINLESIKSSPAVMLLGRATLTVTEKSCPELPKGAKETTLAAVDATKDSDLLSAEDMSTLYGNALIRICNNDPLLEALKELEARADDGAPVKFSIDYDATLTCALNPPKVSPAHQA